MNLKKFAMEVAKLEGGKKSVNLAQIEEVLKCANVVFNRLNAIEKYDMIVRLNKQNKRFNNKRG